MPPSKQDRWISKEENRVKILMAIHQPLTTNQISRKTRIPTATCNHIIRKFTAVGLTVCLNPQAQNSRVYGLTSLGIRCRQQLGRDKTDQPYKDDDCPSVNWELYGSLCFSQRGNVIKTLTEPLQPSVIRRILHVRKPGLKISANNVRDVIRIFLAQGIVQPVRIKNKGHLRYKLTPLGLQLQQLLIQADLPISSSYK